MKNVSALNLLLALFLSLFVGCEDFDDYSTNPNHYLRFSVDTLSFDTIFSSVGSTTKQFVVYNPNNEALKIESIQLANAGKSGFRINVDGRKGDGDSFKEINIWKNDSLYILVEVTVDPNGANQPLVIEDSILFYTNGNRQSVLLQAYGQDIHLIKGGVAYSENITFTADLPYLIYDSIVVNEGATLTIEKGAALYMHHKAKLKIAGTVKAIGTQEEPIVIRGDRLDYISVNGLMLPYDRTPGLWDGIYFEQSSYENEFDYVSVRNGMFGLTFWESDTERLKMRLTNSQITNMDSTIIMAVNCHLEVINSELTNTAGPALALIGGKYQFTHCTVENRRILGKSRNHEMTTLMLCNKAKKNNKEIVHPLKQAFFDNCIISGSNTRELSLFTNDKSEEQGNDETFNYRFNSCYIRTDSVSNSRFVNSLFSNPPRYVKMGDEEDVYEYDFRLKNESTGIGKADRVVAEKYPVDRYGVNRLTSETGPSLGAHEYVYQEEKDKK